MKDGMGYAPFNWKSAGRAVKATFIVEGEIDAMTIEQAGHSAISIRGCGNVNKFTEWLESHKPIHPLILALDNDAAGTTAQTKLSAKLDRQYWRQYRKAGYV